MEKADIETIPIKKTFDLKDEKDAYDAAEEMVEIGFYKEKKGFKVLDRKSTRLNSSHVVISYAVFCLKKKKKKHRHNRQTSCLNQKES